MTSAGIYVIKNTANGKLYCGQSINVTKRLQGHLSKLVAGKHQNAHLQAAFNKYGSEAFETRVIEYCSAGIMDIRERYWIMLYKCAEAKFGYNVEAGGSTGKVVSLETRAKMSASRKGRVYSEEARANMSAAAKGHMCSEATRIKMSGRVWSEETRAKLSAANKRRVCSEATRVKLSAAKKGRVCSEEVRAKISASRKGYMCSDATRSKMSAAKKAHWATRDRLSGKQALCLRYV